MSGREELLLEVTKVSKRFGGVQAVRELSLGMTRVKCSG